MFRKLLFMFALIGVAAFAGEYKEGDEVPFVEGQSAPSAQAGWSWCLEKHPAVYKTVTQRVQVRPASWYMEAVPAKYKEVEERVQVEPEKRRAIMVCPAKYGEKVERRLVKEGRIEYQTVPAQYQDVESEIEVAPERRERIPAQPRYEEYTEKVLVKPAQTVRVPVPGCDADSSKIECYSAREIPAEYQYVTKKRLADPGKDSEYVVPAQKRRVKTRKLVRAASVKEVKIPDQYEDYKVKVLIEPAKFRYEVEPAKFRTIKKSVMTEPESQRRVEIPAKYEDLPVTEMVKPETFVWVYKENKGCKVKQAVKEKACKINPFSKLGRKKEKVEKVK